MEKPGPMTTENGKRSGSGFVSRDNDDPTAEAIYTFMLQKRIPRSITAIWNMIPFWNGTRKIKKAERAEGLAAMDDVCKLLPDLAGVVLVGTTAWRARSYFESKNLPVIMSYHPSPIVRAASRSRWEMIPTQWSEALKLIG